jgi:Fe/S biogenesis protein NfuA
MTNKPLVDDVLTITDSAKTKIYELISQKNRTDLSLRAEIVQTPTGHQTEFKFINQDTKNEDDIIQNAGDFHVIMDPFSASNLEGAVVDFIEDGNPPGFNIQYARPIIPVQPTKEWDDPVAIAVQEVIDNQINPGIAGHGGWVKLLDVKGDVAYIEMGGGCKGCMMAYMTLKNGIESSILNSVPEIKTVLDTTEHADGTNPYYSSDGEGQSPLG